MKSRLVIQLLAVMMVVYSFNNSMAQKNDWQKQHLNGKVKSIKFVTYKAIVDKLGEIQKGEIIDRSDEIFNNKGNMIEMDFYDSDGNIYPKYIYKYDEGGSLIECKANESDGGLDNKYIFKYDKSGNYIESKNYDQLGILISKETFKYDNKGNQIEEHRYSSNETFARYSVDKN